jgi:hypothetical protein
MNNEKELRDIDCPFIEIASMALVALIPWSSDLFTFTVSLTSNNMYNDDV